MDGKPPTPPVEDLVAGNAFRERLIREGRVDHWNGPAPLWHGWAIMDAFLAGLAHEREACAVLMESGRFCRRADHNQGVCECGERAAAIRARGTARPESAP